MGQRKAEMHDMAAAADWKPSKLTTAGYLLGEQRTARIERSHDRQS